MTYPDGSPVQFPLAFFVKDDQEPRVLGEVFDNPNHTTIYWRSGAMSTDDSARVNRRITLLVGGDMKNGEYSPTTVEALLAEWQPLNDAVVVPEFPFILDVRGTLGSRLRALEFTSDTEFIGYYTGGESTPGTTGDMPETSARNIVAQLTGRGQLKYITREELDALLKEDPESDPIGAIARKLVDGITFPVAILPPTDMEDAPFGIVFEAFNNAVQYKRNGTRSKVDLLKGFSLLAMLAAGKVPKDKIVTKEAILAEWTPEFEKIPKIPYPFIVAPERTVEGLIAIEYRSNLDATAYLSDGTSEDHVVPESEYRITGEDAMAAVHFDPASHLITREELESLRSKARPESTGAITVTE